MANYNTDIEILSIFGDDNYITDLLTDFLDDHRDVESAIELTINVIESYHWEEVIEDLPVPAQLRLIEIIEEIAYRLAD